MSRLFTILLCCWLYFQGSLVALGQYYSMGQDPASTRWVQIQTVNFQVIFPENYKEQGTYIANVLEYAYRHGGKTLAHKPRKVSVIIHNQTVVSNGFVSWAPRRIEMFTNPPQDNDSHDWLESLALHEFRHIVQIDKLNQGVTRLLAYLFGEQATAAVLGLFVPMWFVEGDAVAIETALTHSGRGRLPVFEQGLRAQVLQEGIYSFDKAVLGSLRDHVPNYYELGYQLVASARRKYGAHIWDDVLTFVARKPFTVSPFTIGLKKHAGVNRLEHYKNTMNMLDSAWTLQREKHAYTPYEVINPSKKLFSSYRYPEFINDTTLIALKTSIEDIPAVVALGLDGQERLLFRPGLLQAHALSANPEVIVWSELRKDPRWEHRSWSEVYRYELKTGKNEKLTRKTRFFSPSVSNDGSLIAAVEVTSQNIYSLVILDAATGSLIGKFSTPENDFLMTPSWHQNNTTIIAVALNESGKRLVVMDINEEEFTSVFHAGHTEISRPRFYSPEGVFFNGAFSGIDNVYSLDIPTAAVHKVVSSEFGALDAILSPNGGLLLWSDYSSMGYDVACCSMDLVDGIKLEEVDDHSLKMYETLSDQEGVLLTRSQVPRTDYMTIPYHKGENLFLFHSWGPMSIDTDNLEGNPGFSLLSQNKLSTSFANIGYEYDLNEGLGKYYVKYRYEGFYPALDMTAETGLRRSHYRNNQDELVAFVWRENNWQLGGTIPLTFQKGAYRMGLMPSLQAGFRNIAAVSESPDFLRDNRITTMEYRLFAYRQRRSVPRDIRPRWGQVLDVNYRHTPFSTGDMGEVFSTRMVVFFPGLLPHHSLRLTGSYQQRKQGEERKQTINYSFPNLINYPRGINRRFDDQVSVFSVDYAFPIIYPDWCIPQLVFFKRISSNVFYDYARVKYSEQQASQQVRSLEGNLHSLGVDLLAHVHLFRFFFPLDLGVRTYLPSDQERIQFQFLWSVSF